MSRCFTWFPNWFVLGELNIYIYTRTWFVLQGSGKVSAENTKSAEHYTSYGNSFRIYGDFEEILK